jgi:LCP family protein required for cell wall assembly
MDKFKKIIKILLRIFIVLVVLILVSGIGVFAAVKYLRWQADARENPNRSGIAAILSPDKKTEDKVTALFMGVNGPLTDFIMLAQYDPNTRDVDLLSVPRDTKYSGAKINAQYGGKHPEKTVTAVESITGVKVDYYVVFDTKILRNVVDEIGGVTVDVKINMNYDDPAQDLYIHLKKGTQTLTGKQAEQFVRFRKNNDGTGYVNGDVGRIEAQQQFIKAAFEQVLKPQNIAKIGKLVNIVIDGTKTNVTFEDAKKYFDDIATFRTDRIEMATLPGYGAYEDGISYFFHDEKKTEELIKTMFLNKGGESETVETNQVESSDGKVRIEVLNASSNADFLIKVTEKLNEKGYFVAKTGNYSSTKTESSRIIRYSDDDSGAEIKELLGISKLEDEKKDSNVDFTIIIGTNYEL